MRSVRRSTATLSPVNEWDMKRNGVDVTPDTHFMHLKISSKRSEKSKFSDFSERFDKNQMQNTA
jgi:hypothetical protein